MKMLLRSLQKTEVYETLLFGCKIIGNENLERPKMFTGSGPAQPFLDYALINLIAVCFFPIPFGP